MDVQRFEAIAYAQAAKGVTFVQCVFVDRWESKVAQNKVETPKTYLYKVAPGQVVVKDDMVLVQVFNGDYSVAQVIKLLKGPPQIEEYDYSKPLKWVVQKIDLDRSEKLSEMDRQVLKALSQVSLQSRIAQLGQALGVDLMQVVEKMDTPVIES